MNWFLLALKNTFNFKGRSRRREFGWYYLIVFTIGFSMSLIQEFAMMLNLTGFGNFLGSTYDLISYVLTITAVSLVTRRLHDLGRSGWWQLIIYLPLIYIYWQTYQLTSSLHPNAITQAIYMDVSLPFISIGFSLTILVMYSILLFKDGQKHANKYGESPKYPSDAHSEYSTNLTA
ncbi:hypothetical protein A1D29_03360 [Pasteurellaceae bacterium Orientalotternb1]|nr:hypothetical protein A1D29_03360 [Pasteurellaceae bacterium Orientalotternb1]